MKRNKTVFLFASGGITKDEAEEIKRLATTGIYVIAIDIKGLKTPILPGN